MSLENTISKTLAEKNAEEMATYFGKDEYGVKYYNKEDKEISDDPKTLTEKNAEGIKKYFAEGEYGVKHYDKDDKEIVDKIEVESDEDMNARELDNLKREVAEARKKYATVDYEEDKKMGMLRRILGLKGKNLDTDTRRNAHNDYRIRLTELSDYEVNKLRESGMKDEELTAEMEGLVKYFDTDEKTNLYEARTNARTKAWEGKMGGKVMEKAGDFVNWYRKQNVWAKGAVGMALTASGLGVAALGMRAVGGAATGVGIAASLEARHRMQEKNKTEAQRKEFTAQLKGKESEAKLNVLMGKLTAEIDSYKGSLQNEKKQALKRKMIGAGVGIFIGSGAMGKLLGGGLHMIAETDTFKEVSQYVASSEIVKTTASFWKEKLGSMFASGGIHHAATLNNMPGGEAVHATNFDNLSNSEAAHTATLNNLPADDFAAALKAESAAAHFDADPIMKTVENHEVGAGKILDMHMDDSTGHLGVSPNGMQEMAENKATGSTFDDPVWRNATYAHPAAESGNILDMHMNSEGHLDIKPDDIAGIGNVDLEVTKGSSLEGTLIKHFKDAGMDVQEAGAKAHQVALAYAKENQLDGGPQSLIHPGAHIEVNAEGKILSISGDNKLGYLHPHQVEVPPASPVEVVPEPVAAMPDAPANPIEAPAQAVPVTPETPIAATPSEAPVSSMGYDHDSGLNEDHGQAVASGAAEIHNAAVHETATGSMGHDYDSGLNDAPKAASITPEAPGVVPHEAPVAEHVIAPHEAVAPVESPYGYENFSQDLDRSAQELAQSKAAIFSQYSGEIVNEKDIYDRINQLQEKITQMNAGGNGGILEISPLTMAEQQQLDMLNNYKEGFHKTYVKMMGAFLDIKDGSNIDSLRSNANQYLAEHQSERAAKIFENLKKIISPEQMQQYNLDPQPSDSVLDWSARVAKFMLKNKLEK